MGNTAVYNDWSSASFDYDFIVWINNLGDESVPYNLETITENNLAGILTGFRSSYTELNNAGDNWNGHTLDLAPTDVLRDPLHGDYRPINPDFNYGAYNYVDNDDYSIPGRKEENKVRMPLPWDGSEYVPIDVDLKWQHCSNGCTYEVFFGDSESALSSLGTTTSNVMPISETLIEGNTYYWKVSTDSGFESSVWSFSVGYYSETCDESVAEQELRDLASALSTNGVWGNNAYCQDDVVRDFYGNSIYMKSKSCKTAKCGKEMRYQSIECDFQAIAEANSISGNPVFLSQIAGKLSGDDCFGTGEVCDAEVFPDVTDFEPMTSDFEWTSCHFDFLLAETSALQSTIGSAGAWSNSGYCDNAEVEAFWRQTTFLATGLCNDDEILEAGSFVLSNWFGRTVIPNLAECYPLGESDEKVEIREY